MGLNELLQVLLKIEATSESIQKKWEATMATLQEFQVLLSSIDTQTTAIGVEVTRIAGVISGLLGQLAAGGLTAQEEAEVLAQGQASVDALKAAVDPLTLVGSNLP